MYPWHYHLKEGDVVEEVRDFLVCANSDCWTQGCCLQGDARPIQKFAFVLVLEYGY